MEESWSTPGNNNEDELSGSSQVFTTPKGVIYGDKGSGVIPFPSGELDTPETDLVGSAGRLNSRSSPGLDQEEEVRVFDYDETPVSDGTIEENFEEQLGSSPFVVPPAVAPPDEDFCDISSHGIVEVVGDDAYGRKIIVVAACKLPSNKDFDHPRFLRYLLYTLDQFVEQDYSLVYFHHGLNSKNKPSLGWLYQAYKAFHRKYKKNLKALYLVHPTSFIKVTFQLFKPVVSAKFGRKVVYINQLSELNQYLRLDQLCIPQQVKEYDSQLVNRSRAPPSSQVTCTTDSGKMVPVTQQFGVTIQFIKANNGGDPISPLLRQCVEYLSQPEALATEGIFRRSSSTSLVKLTQEKANLGQEIDFRGDFHLAAVLIKAFLRELEEPLLTFAMFEKIVGFQSLSKEDRPAFAKKLIQEHLPTENYVVLKFIVQFLGKVIDSAELNKMTSANLSVVFGPNLVWSKDLALNLAAIAPINTFTECLFSHHLDIFAA